MKPLIIASLAAAAGMWIVAGIWHEVLAAHFYTADTAPHQGVGLILVAYVVLAGLMALFYRRGFSNGRPLLNGAWFGALAGLFWVLPYTLSMAAAHGEPVTGVFANAGWHMVEQGVGGVIIALVLARLDRQWNRRDLRGVPD